MRGRRAALAFRHQNKSQENFVSITLKGANEIIQKRIVTVGLLDRSLVHPRDGSPTSSPIARRPLSSLTTIHQAIYSRATKT
jgi:DNA repair protein RadC